ncbi:MAG TPA: Ada metal-binding domain-containing protein, partial [Phycisphaerae bacterium]|nr:Ada metal-binding domain-containing protein [Phycisphaerae bacterium]
MKTLPKPAVMLRAFRSKDASFEGVFFVGIRTTGVFCRPTCRAKMARESNMEFFADAAAALRDGYRPCKLCRPMEHEPAALVKRLMAQVETAAGRVTERELRAMGVDPSTARRQFQRHCRMTFAAYQRAWRVGAAAGRMARGAPVISGQLAAGYASASGFRAARKRMLGTKGTAALWSKRFQTPLGPMIGICSDEGILVADFVDRKGLAAEIERLQGRDKTPIVPGDHQHLKMLATQ